METSQYEILSKKRKRLISEYGLNPNDILKDRIDLITNQLIDIDNSIARSCCVGGNYKSALYYEIECAKFNFIDEIGVSFGFYKVINWLSCKINKL